MAKFSQPSQAASVVLDLHNAVAKVMKGKPQAIKAGLLAMFARGHLLIEDIPGVGKTTLARAIAAAAGGTFRRVQFTSDLLPSDILGVSIYDETSRSFEFKRGPLFANFVLADEINRTTPRTQSALLEAMSEASVSVEDRTIALDRPFMVLATQNPAEQYGTYPLPESQLDRFLLRISIGYPSFEIERDVLRTRTGDPVAELHAVTDLATINEICDLVEQVSVADGVVDYAMRIIDETRRHVGLATGVSTRGALGWYRVAQAAAVYDGRDFAIPDDFKSTAAMALAHRVTLATASDQATKQRVESERIINEIVGKVAVPT